MALLGRMEATMVPSHETEQWLNSTQVEAAKASSNVGEFQQVFRADAIALLDEGADESQVYSRIDVIAKATKDQTHIAIAKTDANVLGYAQVGGGDAGIVLSEQRFGSITTLDDAVQMQHTGAHEQRHGEQAKLQGGVVFNGDSVDALLLYEGDAELAANTEMAMAATEHREGQPDAVYAEGQNVACAIQQVVGKELWNTVLTETGDTQALQRKLDEAGVGRSDVSELQEARGAYGFLSPGIAGSGYRE